MWSNDAARIAEFLAGVGLPVRRERIVGKCFMPGVSVKAGGLVCDEEALAHAGDLLHEAGHLAVMTAADRAACDGDAGPDGGAEMAAIAWSYAAAVALGMNARVVFHEDGYKGGGAALAENFEQGRYFGVPLLQWYGMTDGGYPAMTAWLRA